MMKPYSRVQGDAVIEHWDRRALKGRMWAVSVVTTARQGVEWVFGVEVGWASCLPSSLDAH